jgi:hypothetical protein
LATPSGAGTLALQIKAGAVITNFNGTAVNTTSALPDDTTLTVNAGSGPARGTITFDGPASFTSANAGTLTRTFDASGSDKLVVIVTGENGNPGDLTGNSSAVTYDGTALNKIIDRNPIAGTPFDQTYNDIWYLDNPGAVHTTGAISATVNSRGNITVFGPSGTAPGAGQTAISAQASKSVVLSTGFPNSIVIACHGMGGDGNSANVTAVDAVAPLLETSATAQASGSPSPWDGHVTAYALMPAPGTASHSFTGGNLVGSHTIAAEFLAAELPIGTPYTLWTAGPFASMLTDPTASLDFDNGRSWHPASHRDQQHLRRSHPQRLNAYRQRQCERLRHRNPHHQRRHHPGKRQRPILHHHQQPRLEWKLQPQPWHHRIGRMDLQR